MDAPALNRGRNQYEKQLLLSVAYPVLFGGKGVIKKSFLSNTKRKTKTVKRKCQKKFLNKTTVLKFHRVFFLSKINTENMSFTPGK